MLTALLVRLGLTQKVSRLLGVLIPLGLVIALCGFLWLRGEHFRKSADKWHEATLKWEAANDMATAWARAEVARNQAAFTETRIKADDKVATLADDFVRLGRLRVKTCEGGSVTADPASQSADTQSTVGRDSPSVVVEAADVDACSVIAARLTVAKEWADDLKERGLAE